MKIVIAPDSYKECLNAMDVATEIENGFKAIFPHATYIKLPMADGGEGTVESMVLATHGNIISVPVQGPLGTLVDGFFGMLGDNKTAVIEMAAASGLHLIPPKERNPLKTSTYGTGQLILAAIEHGAKQIILGIGGSATNDGGAGMMQALGCVFKDKQGQDLPAGGGALIDLDTIDISQLTPQLNGIHFIAACDVNNPLCGDNGASAIFGPQKGATADMVKHLDQALLNYGQKLEKLTNKPIIHVAGVGAAGGMGAALLGFLNAELKPGIDIVVESLKLAEIVQDADLVITGEGKTDSQTIKGKTPIGVAKVAKRYHKPVICISGCLSADYDVVLSHGIDAAFSTVYRIATIDEALAEARHSLYRTALNVASVWRLGQSHQA